MSFSFAGSTTFYLCRLFSLDHETAPLFFSGVRKEESGSWKNVKLRYVVLTLL